MTSVRPNLLRRLLPWLLGTALVVLAAMSVYFSLALRRELYSQVSSDLEQRLQDAVSAWEQDILQQLVQWQEQAGADPENAWRLEMRLRQSVPWFDSLYLWLPPRDVLVGADRRRRPAGFLFPKPPPSSRDQGVGDDECIRRAELQARIPGADPLRIAQQYVLGCRQKAPSVRLHAAAEAAALLYNHDRYDAALNALDGAGIDATMSLRRAIESGIDPAEVVDARLLRAQLLRKLGRDDEALDVVYATGLEIAAMDAPEAVAVRHFAWNVHYLLRQGERTEQARRVADAFEQLDRRIGAWNEIAQRIMQRTSGPQTEESRFVYDQYSKTPFLLYYGPIQNGEMYAAIQVDQPVLLDDFLGRMQRYRDQIVIADDDGNHVKGARSGGPIVVQVPFSRTLKNLRVGLREEALERHLVRLDQQWVIPIVISGFAVVLGLIGWATLVRAERQLLALLVRQREFTTRVTHELKTPLAGIKVMAENLESGAFQGDRDREEMARSILLEADRLAQRVDEILAVARERKLPTPEPFDPEEPVLEAIDSWGPRLEQAGVTLHADLHPTDRVVGDGAAFRDAIGCLLDNALKYRREDRPNAQVWLTMMQEEGEIVVDVCDNGIGVPKPMRKQIFERFVRVEGPNRGKAGGHGLGLAQVKETVEAMSGRVECNDGIDGGARFVLRVPAAG